MTPLRIAGIILLVLGIAGFFTGGFSFTKETTKAQIGPLKVQVQEKDSVNVPQSPPRWRRRCKACPTAPP